MSAGSWTSAVESNSVIIGTGFKVEGLGHIGPEAGVGGG